MYQQKRISLADRVFEKLENDILTGKYKYGEIITETRLSEELGVSRTPIREAIRELEQEKIIRETGKGMMVIGITKENLSDIYEIRLRIEGLAAKKAAQNISEDEVKRLLEILELQEFYTSKKDSDHIKDTDSDFHNMIYDCCKSEILKDTLLPLHRKIKKFRKASVESGNRAAEAAGEHRKIFEAISSHDGDLAEKLMTEHIKNARDNILKNVGE